MALVVEGREDIKQELDLTGLHQNSRLTYRQNPVVLFVQVCHPAKTLEFCFSYLYRLFS